MKTKKFFLINIIPLARLPPQAPDFFSYFSNKNIKKGALVEIEFKKRKILGYVYSLESLEKKRYFLKEEKIQLKPVLKIVNQNPLIFPYQLNLAFWLKNYMAISLASALSLFFPYKKLFWYRSKVRSNFASSSFASGSGIKILHKEELFLEDLKNKKTLIIVPQDNYLAYLKEKYGVKNIISSKTSEKKFFELVEKILGKNKEIFLSTKNGIFLPWQFLDQIIVYDEGSIFYKEFFKPPYFDYRKIFLKFAELNKIEYLAIGKLPSLYQSKILGTGQALKWPGINFQRISSLTEFEEKIKKLKN